MADLYLSHADADRRLADRLRKALGDRGTRCHADVTRMGDRALLPPEVVDAIDGSAGLVVLATPAGCQSPQVRAEVAHALGRGAGHQVAIIAHTLTPEALAIDWPELAMRGAFHLPDTPNDAELGRAVGRALAMLRPGGALRHETIIDFGDIRRDGDRVTAWVRIDERAGELTVPIGPIEAEALRWYLERYHRWPAAEFDKRARAIEAELPKWGDKLWAALLDALGGELPEWLAATETGRRLLTLRVAAPRPVPTTRASLEAATASATPALRSAVLAATRQLVVETRGDDPQTDEIAQAAAENDAQSRLLALPWELLRKSGGYLFQRDPAVDIRRVIGPREHRAPLQPSAPPIRVLVVVARPDKAGLIDPRASADALIDAVTPLGGAVELTFLRPPTVDALAAALRETRYDVLHFDGHGVYDRRTGLGYLCFEHRDAEQRRAGAPELIPGDALRAAIGDRRLPLAFLEACQTAQSADDADSAVASALLAAGAESVVAMSHSVLVTTATLFTQAFYAALIKGNTVAEAVTAARQTLAANTQRGGTLELTDWYVPVLFQRGEDPVLWTGGRDIHADPRAARERDKRHATLPTLDTHHFVGRLRERLALERALEDHPLALVVGVGGQGKTTLAAELARWLVRCERFRAAAFVSMEQSPPIEGVLSTLGRALIGPKFVMPGAGPAAIAEATEQLVDALHRHPALVVFDNFETLLAPPADAPAAERLTDQPELRSALLELAWTLAHAGESRVIITCREGLPDRRFGPGKSCHVLRLGPLPVRDAIELVGQLCRHAGVATDAVDDAALEELVRAVGCHARSLVRLPELLRDRGVGAVTGDLHGLMAELDAKYPDERERSLLASLRLSLDRLPRRWRALLPPLGLLRVGVFDQIMGLLLDFDERERHGLANALEAHGLAHRELDGTYLRFHPALPALLEAELRATRPPAEVEARWQRTVEVYVGLVGSLYSMLSRPQEAVAVRLCVAELPNLLRVLDHLVAMTGDDPAGVGSAIEYATELEGLLHTTAHRRELAGVAERRARLAERAPADGWSHAHHIAATATVERHLEAGQLATALAAAENAHTRGAPAAAGGEPYPEAAYDRAVTAFTLGRVRKKTGRPEAALTNIEQARQGFEALAAGGNRGAARMASVCLLEGADCLLDMGRLADAAARYEQAIEALTPLDDPRSVAVACGQLATARLLQGEHDAALAGHQQARDAFATLDEPTAVASAWHQIGRVHEEVGCLAQAEAAYTEAVALFDHGVHLDAAGSMSQLAIVTDRADRLQEAVAWERRALDIRVRQGDRVGEAKSRNNLADRLRRLDRLDEAAAEARQAAVIRDDLGVGAEPWKTWAILHDIHRDRGAHAAAAEARRRASAWYAHYRGQRGEPEAIVARLLTTTRQALAAGHGAALAGQLPAAAVNQKTHTNNRALLQTLAAVCRSDFDAARAALDTLHSVFAFELDLLLTGRWPDAPPADPPPPLDPPADPRS